MTKAISPSPRFAPGRLKSTPGALDALDAAKACYFTHLDRHFRGDWGTIDDEDWAANEEAISTGERLMSAYFLSTGVKIWIITERDRTVTTALLPEEY